MIKKIISFFSLMYLLVYAGCSSFDKIPLDLDISSQATEDRLEVINGTYTINAPDVIQIEVQDNPDFGTTAVIMPDGNVFIPMLGNVYVDGLTLMQLREKMHKLMGMYLKDLPIESIKVQVVGFNSKKVFVHSYGDTSIAAIPFTGNLNFLDAISQSGFANTSKKRKMTIIRPAKDPAKKPQRLVLNLNDIIKKGRTEKDITLRENDIIYLPPTLLGRIGLKIRTLLFPVQPIAEVGATYGNIQYNALGFNSQQDDYGRGGNRSNYNYSNDRY
jgi:polysaccharide export outer membrane protein